MVYKKKLETFDRFLSHVEKTDTCWNWKLKLDPDGYGHFWMNKKNLIAHRASWNLFKKILIPEGWQVLHKCDNRKCVNPDHLFLGSQKANIQDALRKNRMIGPRGEKQHCSIFTTNEVLEIRYLNKKGMNGNQLAKKYGVERRVIYDILKRMTWKHI